MGKNHLLAVVAVLLAATPVASAFPLLANQPPSVQSVIRAGVLRFHHALQQGGMLRVIDDVRTCYRPHIHPGAGLPLMVCLAEDDAGYDFSVGAKVFQHFPPLPFYRRSTYFTRQMRIATRADLVPAKSRLAFIEGYLGFVGQEMQVVMGPPNQQ